jgi:hypothetical protein
MAPRGVLQRASSFLPREAEHQVSGREEGVR